METIIVLVIIAALGFWVAAIYNKLIALKNRFENGFAQIEVQLKRRYDLIPNLVEVAKGYMAHERETLEAVISARNQAMAGLQAAAASQQVDVSELIARSSKNPLEERVAAIERQLEEIRSKEPE